MIKRTIELTPKHQQLVTYTEANRSVAEFTEIGQDLTDIDKIAEHKLRHNYNPTASVTVRTKQ